MISVYNPTSGAVEKVTSESKSINDYVTHPMTSTQNNAATILTQEGVPGKQWCIGYANWRVSGGSTAAANQAVTISDGSTVIYRSAVPASSPNGTNLAIDLSHAIMCGIGNSVSFNIGASGTAGTLIHSNFGLFLK